MFKLQKAETFKWPVHVNVPRDGGGFSTHEFTAEFRLHEQSKIDHLIDRLRQDDQDILRELLVGWGNVADANGDPMQYTEANRDILIDIPYVRSALLKAYFEAVSGNKVKRGN